MEKKSFKIGPGALFGGLFLLFIIGGILGALNPNPNDNSASSPTVTMPITSNEAPIVVSSASQPVVSKVTQKPVVNEQQNIISAPVPTPAPAVVVNYSSYETLPSDFSKNPPYYVGTKVKVSGTVVDFLAAGDRGGTANYIEIVPTTPQVDSLPFMVLEIDSSVNYEQAVSVLNKVDSITAYGTIIASQEFTSTYGAPRLVPVLDVARLDKCGTQLFCTSSTGIQTIFPYIPPTANSSTDVGNPFVSISAIWQNPSLYINTSLTTKGRVIQILSSSSDSNSLVFMQDPNQNSGSVSFEVDSAYLLNNQIKVGSTLQVVGLLVSLTDPIISSIGQKYQIANTGGSYYITNGTVTVSS